MALSNKLCNNLPAFKKIQTLDEARLKKYFNFVVILEFMFFTDGILNTLYPFIKKNHHICLNKMLYKSGKYIKNIFF